MDSISYQAILEKNLLPFTLKQYPRGFRLYQDNDAKHKSRSTMAWLQGHGIISLKENLRQKVKPRTKQELVDGIKEFWISLTPAKCGRYIDHIHKVMPVIVLNNGGPSDY